MSGKQYRVPVGFAAVLKRLGIVGPDISFDLADIVVPVALVDPDPFVANALPPTFGVPASNGNAIYGAAARMADTGPLPAGNYYITIWYSGVDASGRSYLLRRRNAADAADVWSQQIRNIQYGGLIVTLRLLLLLNERLVFETVGAGATAEQVNIFAALT